MIIVFTYYLLGLIWACISDGVSCVFIGDGRMGSVGEISGMSLWLMVWMEEWWEGKGNVRWNRWDKDSESVAYVCQIVVNDEARDFPSAVLLRMW